MKGVFLINAGYKANDLGRLGTGSAPQQEE